MIANYNEKDEENDLSTFLVANQPYFNKVKGSQRGSNGIRKGQRVMKG